MSMFVHVILRVNVCYKPKLELKSSIKFCNKRMTSYDAKSVKQLSQLALGGKTSSTSNICKLII